MSERSPKAEEEVSSTSRLELPIQRDVKDFRLLLAKMANLLDSVENSVWHAFDFLALDGDGTSSKAKLKVKITK